MICSNGFAIRRRGNVMSSASQRAESRFRKPIVLRDGECSLACFRGWATEEVAVQDVADPAFELLRRPA